MQAQTSVKRGAYCSEKIQLILCLCHPKMWKVTLVNNNFKRSTNHLLMSTPSLSLILMAAQLLKYTWAIGREKSIMLVVLHVCLKTCAQALLFLQLLILKSGKDVLSDTQCPPPPVAHPSHGLLLNTPLHHYWRWSDASWLTYCFLWPHTCKREIHAQ